MIARHRHRRRTAAIAMAAILATIALGGLPATGRGAAAVRGRRVVIGRSGEGRPIVAWAYGPSTAPRKILVIGVIHGDEQAGLAITHALRGLPVPAGVQLWVLPELNPDGVAADTRRTRTESISTGTSRSGGRTRAIRHSTPGRGRPPSPRREPRCAWCGGSGPR